MPRLSRRQMIASTGACLGMGMLGTMPAIAAAPATDAKSPAKPAAGPFRFCLNTGTLAGFNLPVAQMIDIAAKAGYQGIEPWARDVDRDVAKGAKVEDLARRAADAGLVVEDVIAFGQWIVDDDAARAKGLEQMKRDMDLVARLGGHCIAAPPSGANNVAGMDPRKIGERYRAALELGRKMGVVPLLECGACRKPSAG
jgi:2-keto-myo-inositol isomerase